MPFFPGGPSIVASDATYAGGVVVFSGSAGGNLTVGTNGRSILLSAAAAPAASVSFSGGTSTAALGSLVFSNASGVSWGLNGSTLTATVQTNYLTTAMASNRGTDFVQATAAFAGTSASGTINSTGISVSIGPYLTTAMASNAAVVQSANGSSGQVTWSAGNLMSVSNNASTVSIINLLSSSAIANPVSSASAAGTLSSRFALADHAHAGLNSVSLVGNTAGQSTAGAGSLVLAGGPNITLSGATAAGGMTVSVSADPHPMASYFANVPYLNMVTGAGAITQTSGSSMFLQPFFLPYPISVSYVRFLASLNDSAVGTAGTTSANQTFSVGCFSTFGLVIYSRGVGASSRSIQSLSSTQGGFTGKTFYQAGAQGSQYTITIQKTYPLSGNNTDSYTSSYAVSSASIVISSNSNTLFTGPQFLDIPWAGSLAPGAYWLGIGASTSSATNSSHISFAGTCVLPMSLAGISQSNVSVGPMGAATAASNNQFMLGLGVWTTNASIFTKDSIGLNSVSQVVSNPILPFQFIRQA